MVILMFGNLRSFNAEATEGEDAENEDYHTQYLCTSVHSAFL